MARQESFSAFGMAWASEPFPSRMGRKAVNAPPQTPLQDEPPRTPRGEMLKMPCKDEPPRTPLNPADASVELLHEGPTPADGEDVLGAQTHAMVPRLGPARSVPANMPTIQEHPQRPTASSTPAAPAATPQYPQPQLLHRSSQDLEDTGHRCRDSTNILEEIRFPSYSDWQDLPECHPAKLSTRRSVGKSPSKNATQCPSQ